MGKKPLQDLILTYFWALQKIQILDTFKQYLGLSFSENDHSDKFSLDISIMDHGLKFLNSMTICRNQQKVDFEDLRILIMLFDLDMYISYISG